ncbi:P-loop containing nucleoside triphosphate hydrolase protein [Ramaria rubella]|nr:P-loop containing nucleoside triphosphate hydrolase protein [Ramaria rubella]
MVAQQTHFDTSNPAFRAAADDFRRVTAQDAMILTFIGVGICVSTYTYMFLWVYTGEVMAKRIRELYLRAVLRQDIAFFDNVGAGEVASRIQTDTHLIQQGTSEKVALVVNFLGAFACGFILAYIRSWRLALALSSILPGIAITGGLLNKFMSTYMQLSRNAIAEGGSLAEEVISSVRVTHAFGTQHTLADMYDEYGHRALVVDYKGAVTRGIGMGCLFFVGHSAYALAFYFGTTLVIRGEANAGTVVNVVLAILTGSISLAMMAPEMQAISGACAAASKIFVTIDRVPHIDSASPEGLKPEHVEGRIELENVVFNYPSRPNVPIVKDLTLTFEAGKTAALVGASGSGKSTVVSLVERFYDPLSGVVKLDGRDLRELNVKWLRSQIGLVSQEPTLFATTIEGNVAHGLIGTKFEHAAEEEKMQLIKEACVKANADGFIAKLPHGYKTMVGERGFLLSGGQKQRIAIARAIVSNPPILLLDEATSALDTQSEGLVQDALDRAAAGRTTITIAHRLSTIKDADCIFVVDRGVVLEQGTHGELLALPDGLYARLVSTQKLRETREGGGGDGDGDGGDNGDDGDEQAGGVVDVEKAAQDEIPLGRRSTGSRSLASEILEKRGVGRGGDDDGQRLPLVQLLIRLGEINRETWFLYAFGVIFAAMAGMVYPSVGIVFGGTIQTFQETDVHQLRFDMDRNALWFFIIALGAGMVVALQNYFFASAASQLTFKLRALSFKAILRQDIEFFDRDRNSSGSLASGLSDNPQRVNGLAGVTLGAIVQSLSCVIGGSIVGLAYSWKLALVGIACTPLLVATGYVRLRVVVLKDQKNKNAHEDSAQLACEAAGAIRTVASLTREEDCLALYSNSLEGPLRNSNRTALFSSMLYALSQGMSFFVIALVFWFGSRLISELEIQTKQFFICLMSTVFGAIEAGNVFNFVPDISSAQGAGSSIIRLLDSSPEIDAESPEGKKPENVKGHIRLEGIHFRYPTRPDVRVLRDLNLEVKPGTYIALVGASGCGKSTVIQLIERFYDPLAGNIYIDGQLISELNIQEYRKQIALVSQEPTLYAGTVRFNILLGATKPADQVTQEEIETACRNANILEFIESLPDGFNTEVGGKGSQLSGGQKQRIAIARALIRNPKVLLLDEATSALDSNSEKVVQDALDLAAKGRTTIAIAHRLSTIQNADRIYFIKDGVVSEAGTHDQLLARHGGYYEYVQLQALDKK